MGGATPAPPAPSAAPRPDHGGPAWLEVPIPPTSPPTGAVDGPAPDGTPSPAPSVPMGPPTSWPTPPGPPPSAPGAPVRWPAGPGEPGGGPAGPNGPPVGPDGDGWWGGQPGPPGASAADGWWGGQPGPPTGPGPRRLHWASPLVDVAGIGLALLIFSFGDPSRVAIALVIVLVAAAVRAARWASFTYDLDGRSLITEGGILNRTRRVVPLDRVQQVDVQRKLRHQIFGLAVVRVDTAGTASEAEVTLDAVSVAEAEHLRVALSGPPPASPSSHPAGLGATTEESGAGSWGAPVEAPDPVEEERELVRISPGRLALGGITGSKLFVVFVAVGALAGLINDLPRGLRDQAVDSVSDGARSGVTALLVFALLAIPVIVAVAAGAAVLTDGGYQLTRRGQFLQVRRGLLDHREASLAVHRVQVVRVHQNLLRQALGVVSVTLQSAGGSGQVEQQDARVTVPIMARSDLDALLAEVLPRAPHIPVLPRAPGAARRRAWVRRLVPAVALAVAAVVWLPPYGLLALVLIPLAAVDGELAYRGLGWAAVDDHIVARRGGLIRETALVPVAKVQSTRLASSPFQRRAGLATLYVDVAGQGRTPALIDAVADGVTDLHRDTIDAGAARRDERAVRGRVAAKVGSAGPERLPG